MHLRKIAVLSSIFSMKVTSAFAHGGHLGELAGHSHWVGVGAIIVAGAIAVAAGRLSSKKKEEKEKVPETVEEAG